MFLFVQAMKSHKQPTPSLAFAEHQLLDPRQSRSNPPLSSRSSGPSRTVRARLSCCGHVLERCPALGMGSHWGWELGLTHHWLLGRGSSSSRVSWEQQKGLQSQDSPKFWGLVGGRLCMRHGAPPDPLLRGASYFFGCVGGGLQTLLVPARWGCVFLPYPKYSVLDGDITNLPLYHHLFALGFVLRGVKQKENRNASGWIEIKKPP